MTQALQQLGRGNERFQQLDSEIREVKGRLTVLELRLPEEIARIRADMLRAVGSVVDKTDENIKAALEPINKQLTPITELIGKTHTLLKWFGGIMVTLAVGVITAVVIAFVLQWLTLK